MPVMNVTRDVIRDLLPIYQDGEASAETRRLVDEFLASDPDLAREAAAGPVAMSALQAAPSGAHADRAALERTRRLLLQRQIYFGAALAATLMPLTVVFRNGAITWFMWRDAPSMAGVFIGVAIACWIGFFRARSKLVVAGM
jgi:anti-sigma factor RsiW